MNCVSPYCAIKLLFQHAIRNDKTYFMFAEVIVVVVCACGKFLSFRAEMVVSKEANIRSISNTLFYEIVDLYSMAFLVAFEARRFCAKYQIQSTRFFHVFLPNIHMRINRTFACAAE